MGTGLRFGFDGKVCHADLNSSETYFHALVPVLCIFKAPFPFLVEHRPPWPYSMPGRCLHCGQR